MLTLLVTCVSARDYLDYQEIELDLDIGSSVNLISTGAGAKASDLTAKLTWVPQESFRQELSSFETIPDAKKVDDALLFDWHNPSLGENEYRVLARMKTEFAFKPVTKKIRFPIKQLDPSLYEYTLPAKIIDINPEIEQLALELSNGEDDLFKVVYALADWATINIKYDLSSATSKASLKSSWVLENRRGVCDELTSLFISLNRALGIPARFVAGISYTNLEEFEQPWGPHGWAEVYFPGTGWVPFDVTYGQYGYIDATHIKLKTSVDAEENAVEYTSTGRNIQMDPAELDIQTIPLRNGSLITPFISLRSSLYDDSVGFGSYNLLTITLKNNRNHYASTQVFMSKTDSIEVEEGYSRNVVLAPFEEKEIYWLIKVEDLKKGFLYTFPFEITSPISNSAQIKMKVSESGDIYDRQVFKDIVQTNKERVSRPYSQFVDFTCESDKEALAVGETLGISCQLKNNGQQLLQYLRVCLDGDCGHGTISQGETKDYFFEKSFDEPGLKTMVIRAANSDISKSRLIRAQVLDEASLKIIEVKHPSSISFTSTGDLFFSIEKTSLATPKNLKIEVLHEIVHEDWQLKELIQPQKFKLTIPGNQLSLSNTTFTIKISFTDDLGKSHIETKSVSIIPEKPDFIERLQLVLNSWWSKLID